MPKLLLLEDDPPPDLGPPQLPVVASYPLLGDKRQDLFDVLDGETDHD